LLAKGFVPELVILDCVAGEDANDAEREFISFFRERTRLTNGTAGGDGGAVVDPVAKARIRAAHLGSRHSEETKRQMSESAKKRCQDPKERARLAAISNGKPPVRKGEANNSKLTEDKVREIRQLAGNGLPQKEIAKRFGVTPANISLIVRYKAWEHVK